MPQESKVDRPAQQVETTIVLRVMQRGEGDSALRINQQNVTWAELRGRLRDIYKARATKVMFIHGVEFAHVARAMDSAREAGSGIAIGLMTRNLSRD